MKLYSPGIIHLTIRITNCQNIFLHESLLCRKRNKFHFYVVVYGAESYIFHTNYSLHRNRPKLNASRLFLIGYSKSHPRKSSKIHWAASFSKRPNIPAHKSSRDKITAGCRKTTTLVVPKALFQYG